MILISLCVVLAVAVVVAVTVVSQRFGGPDDQTAAPGAGVVSPVEVARSDEAAVQYGWQRVAGDEFDGRSVDSSQWDIYDGDNSVDESWSSKQCSVSGGLLTLSGKANTAGTTCGIAFKQNQVYGRWEVRARMPVPADPGYAPTFLLWGADDANFPDAGEIDFAEDWDPNRQFVESWLHGPGNLRGPYFKSNPVDLTQWHNFGVDWQPDKITLYLDGQVWGVYDDPKYIPRTPMHLVLQLSYTSKHAGAPRATTAQVDWARVYQ